MTAETTRSPAGLVAPAGNVVLDRDLDRAAALLADATDVIVTAGAGMSVDSGLPDYRGTAGFWREYPVLKGMGVSFEQLNQPQWFDNDPALAWGFLAHCCQLYHRTVPHAGYDVLQRLETEHGKRVCIFTSNVDGAFVKAGFDVGQVYECHGGFRLLQCTVDACAQRNAPWPAQDAITKLTVDPATLRVADAQTTLPRCPRCDSLARPNILLFEDPRFAIVDNVRRQRRSEDAVMEMLRCSADSTSSPRRVVVVEGGSGPTVPTVRRFGEYCHDAGAAMIRINLRESAFPERMSAARDAVPLPLTCSAALTEIEKRMTNILLSAGHGAPHDTRRSCPGVAPPPSSLLTSCRSSAAEGRSPKTTRPSLSLSNPFERLRQDELIV